MTAADEFPGASISQMLGRKAWLALLLLLTINLFNYMDRFVLSAVLPHVGIAFFRPSDPIASTKLGYLSSAFLVCYMCVSPLFGWLADRTSRWRLIGIGVILWSLASGASGLAGFFSAMLVTRMFVGLGEAAYGPVAPTIISDLYSVSSRGKVLAWFYAAMPVGAALGYTLGTFVADSPLGWRWAFFLVVPPGLLLGAICFFMPEPPRETSSRSVAHSPRMREYLELASIPSYVIDTIGGIALTFAIGGIAVWMPTYLIVERHVPEKTVGGLFGAIIVVAGLVATLLGGWVGDLLRPKMKGSYFIVSAFGMFLGFPFFLLSLYAPFPYTWICLFLAIFFLFFNTGPSNTILANVTRPSIRATAFALNIFIIHLLGDVISPPIIGWIRDRNHGGFTQAFGCVSAMMVIGGIAWMLGARYLEQDTLAASEERPSPGLDALRVPSAATFNPPPPR